jgi:environmental stress-induced protein Ves
VRAKLNRGPTTDFNVMSRSERCYHQFGRRRLSGDSTFIARAEITVLFLAEGDSLQLASDNERIGLVRYDAVVLDQGTVWTLEAGQATIYIVDVHYYSDDDDDDMGMYD